MLGGGAALIGAGGIGGGGAATGLVGTCADGGADVGAGGLVGAEPLSSRSIRTTASSATSIYLPCYVVVKDTAVLLLDDMTAEYGSSTISNGASRTLEVIRYSTFEFGDTMAFSAVRVDGIVGGYVPSTLVRTSACANALNRLPMFWSVGVNVVIAFPDAPNACIAFSMPGLLNSSPRNRSLQLSPRQIASTSVIP